MAAKATPGVNSADVNDVGNNNPNSAFVNADSYEDFAAFGIPPMVKNIAMALGLAVICAIGAVVLVALVFLALPFLALPPVAWAIYHELAHANRREDQNWFWRMWSYYDDE